MLLESRFPITTQLAPDVDRALALLASAAEGGTLPGLVLLDLNLAGSDGREVLRHIKSHEALRRIPVVIFSTSQAPDDINECYDLHANAYLTKPFHLGDMRQAIASMCEFWLGQVRPPAAGVEVA